MNRKDYCGVFVHDVRTFRAVIIAATLNLKMMWGVGRADLAPTIKNIQFSSPGSGALGLAFRLGPVSF